MTENSTHPIIYFDGVCMLCNAFVQFVLKRDRNDVFRFSTVQEMEKQEIPANLKTSRDTIILREGGNAFVASDAVIRIVKRLGGVWSLFAIVQYLPRFLRDGMYRFIAQNRFRIFGKTEYCSVMTPQVKKKFLQFEE